MLTRRLATRKEVFWGHIFLNLLTLISLGSSFPGVLGVQTITPRRSEHLLLKVTKRFWVHVSQVLL